MKMRNYIVAGLIFCFSTAGFAEKAYRAPRLPDGHADLQGNWAHLNMVPLERPKEFSSLALSIEQARSVEAKELARSDNLAEPNEPSDTMDVRRVHSIHGQLRSSVVVDPEDGQIPGTTLFMENKARARRSLLGAFDGPEERPLSERCLVSPNSSPPMLLVPANDLRQIVQTADTVILASEPMHDTRIVRMNSHHVPATIASWTGDSIGWWDGETLVIETKRLMPSVVGRAGPFGVYFVSPQTTVVERLTRISKDELLYAFTVEDPSLYTRPWRGETVFTLSSDRIFPFDCHEGNYSLPNALYGERVKEAARSK